VLPPENVDVTPSQSLLKILSMPDRREYVASVTAGPFCERMECGRMPLR